jgi:uncharacterized RDD family membrane protein YckC
VSYPSFSRRYFGIVIDVLCVVLFMYLLVKVAGAELDATTGPLVFLAFGFTYEPLLTIYGATLGQLLMRYRIRRLDSMARISWFQAYVRLVIKGLLGVFSIITVATRKDRRAIHDMLARTIAVDASHSKATTQ